MTSRKARLEWARRRLRRRLRAVRRRLRPYRGSEDGAGAQRVLLILGCQRSGTSLLSDLFDEDPRAVTFPEESALTRRGGARLRLRPLPEVARHLNRLRAPLVVLKPLAESQRAPELLAGLGGAKALWMYRDYRDVAASLVHTFGAENAVRDLARVLAGDPPSWRSELVPDETRGMLEPLYGPDIRPQDAAALFWWARNMLFFQLDLHERNDVRLLSYEALVERTDAVMGGVYDFLGLPLLSAGLDRAAHTRAVGRGHDVGLSPAVEELCRSLHGRLEALRQ